MPEKLEGIFKTNSLLIEDIFVHCDSSSSFLLAVIKPKSQVIEQSVLEKQNSKEELILSDLKLIAKRNNLHLSQIPRAVFIEENMSWGIENGMRTITGKFSRRGAIKHYTNVLEDLKKKVDFDEENLKLKLISEISSVLEKNSSSSDSLQSSDLDLCFRELGGNSLGVITLSNLFQEKFKVKVPPQIIYECESISQLVQYISQGEFFYYFYYFFIYYFIYFFIFYFLFYFFFYFFIFLFYLFY